MALQSAVSLNNQSNNQILKLHLVTMNACSDFTCCAEKSLNLWVTIVYHCRPHIHEYMKL